MSLRSVAHESPRVHRPAPRLWLAALLLFGVGDVATTAVGLAIPGVVEADPLARWMLDRLGLVALPLLKAVAFLACAVVWLVVPHPYSRGVPAGLAAIGAVVTAWNTYVVASVLL